MGSARIAHTPAPRRQTRSRLENSSAGARCPPAGSEPALQISQSSVAGSTWAVSGPGLRGLRGSLPVAHGSWGSRAARAPLPSLLRVQLPPAAARGRGPRAVRAALSGLRSAGWAALVQEGHGQPRAPGGPCAPSKLRGLSAPGTAGPRSSAKRPTSGGHECTPEPPERSDLPRPPALTLTVLWSSSATRSAPEGRAAAGGQLGPRRPPNGRARLQITPRLAAAAPAPPRLPPSAWAWAWASARGQVHAGWRRCGGGGLNLLAPFPPPGSAPRRAARPEGGVSGFKLLIGISHCRVTRGGGDTHAAHSHTLTLAAASGSGLKGEAALRCPARDPAGLEPGRTGLPGLEGPRGAEERQPPQAPGTSETFRRAERPDWLCGGRPRSAQSTEPASWGSRAAGRGTAHSPPRCRAPPRGPALGGRWLARPGRCARAEATDCGALGVRARAERARPRAQRARSETLRPPQVELPRTPGTASWVCPARREKTRELADRQ